MKFLQIFLIIEWPFLLIALALSSWGLSFIIDQRDYKFGTLYPQFGKQIITYSQTWLSTSRENGTPVSVIPRTTYTFTQTLYPNEYGTQFYSSIYSRIGSIPTFEPITKRDGVIPTPAPVIKRNSLETPIAPAPLAERRAYWADHSGIGSNVYGNLGGDTDSLVSAMIIPFSLLIASLAIRILLTPIYLLHFFSIQKRGTKTNPSSAKKSIHSWNIALVSITTIFTVVMLGSMLSGFILYCLYFDSTIDQSVGLIVTIVFTAIVCITSIISLTLMCIQLHKTKKELQFYSQKVDDTTLLDKQ